MGHLTVGPHSECSGAAKQRKAVDGAGSCKMHSPTAISSSILLCASSRCLSLCALPMLQNAALGLGVMLLQEGTTCCHECFHPQAVMDVKRLSQNTAAAEQQASGALFNPLY